MPGGVGEAHTRNTPTPRISILRTTQPASQLRCAVPPHHINPPPPRARPNPPNCTQMARALFVLAALLLVGAASAKSFDALDTLTPYYNVLDVLKWETYPDCWIFPQPAITLVKDQKPYLVAYGDKEVADAWCT
jgi:hypothetical protein